MKIKLKRNTSTGLAVRTTLKAGEKYVPCGCGIIPGVDPHVGLMCDDGKGNTLRVDGNTPALWSWMDTYCKRPGRP